MESILLIEDSRDDIELSVRAWRRVCPDVELMVASDSTRALEITKAANPKAVVLDVKMPKVDGKELLIELRREPKTQFVPVVAFTSSDEAGDVRDVYGLGANAYVKKPVDFDEYLETVEDLVKFWMVLNLPR